MSSAPSVPPTRFPSAPAGKPKIHSAAPSGSSSSANLRLNDSQSSQATTFSPRLMSPIYFRYHTRRQLRLQKTFPVTVGSQSRWCWWGSSSSCVSWAWFYSSSRVTSARKPNEMSSAILVSLYSLIFIIKVSKV